MTPNTVIFDIMYVDMSVDSLLRFQTLHNIHKNIQSYKNIQNVMAIISSRYLQIDKTKLKKIEMR